MGRSGGNSGELLNDRRHPANVSQHPAANALAYSDATLLQGAVAAPFLWAGISPLTVYNVLLLAAEVGR